MSFFFVCIGWLNDLKRLVIIDIPSTSLPEFFQKRLFQDMSSFVVTSKSGIFEADFCNDNQSDADQRCI